MRLTIAFWRQVGDALYLEEEDARDLTVARVLIAAHLLGLFLQPGHAQPLPPLLPLLGLLGLVLGLVRAFLVVLGVSDIAVGTQQELALIVVGARRLTDNGAEALHDLLGRRGGVARVDKGELDLDLARNDRLLLAGAARLEREPARLLQRLAVEEHILEDDVEVAHVVLAEAVLVPAVHLEQQALLVDDGQVDGRVPFGVERFVDRGRGLPGVAEGKHEVLPGQPDIWMSLDATHGVRGAAAVLGREVGALQRGQRALSRGEVAAP
jgi:hypothetical protein